MLQMQILGNVGSDAVVKEHQGEKFMSFSVAHTDKFDDGKGNKVEKTEWVNVTSSKINMAPHIKKGDKIYVQGHPSFNLYNDQQQKVRYSINLRAMIVDFAGSAQQKEAAAG